MMKSIWRSSVLVGAAIVAFSGPLVVSISGCEPKTPDYQTQPPMPPNPTPRPVGTIKPAAAGKVVEGAAFNKIFPPSGVGYTVTYTQEKKGFAQGELTMGGKKAATLSISDTLANPEAKGKFASASENLGGFPAVKVGDKGTAILVGDRFQVQVRSIDASFSESERASWIQKFNLTALQKLAGG